MDPVWVQFISAQMLLHFDEKSGKVRQTPGHHDLQELVEEYVEAAGVGRNGQDAPLFRRTPALAKRLTPQRYVPRLWPENLAPLIPSFPASVGLTYRAVQVEDQLVQGAALVNPINPRTGRGHFRQQFPATTFVFIARFQGVGRTVR